jgi:acetylornithine deacetylase/succinyl-diaminopimelate desuccinylase-like protein
MTHPPEQETIMRSLICSLALLSLGGLSAGPASAQNPSPAHVETVKRIMESPAYKKAVETADKEHDRWVEEVVKLTEIEAPPFKEEKRAKVYAEMFKQHGLTDVEIDPEGNVLGVRKGTGGGPVIVVSAHLDTVFPEGTDVKVTRKGTRLYAPGIGDDSTGLATLLQYVRALEAAGAKTKSDIVFMGTVGEEGLGDLRGVRYFFTKGKYKDQVKAFFSLDGGGVTDVTTGGVGSKRYRVTFKGPGGHSFGAFGLVNPMAAMSQAVVELYKLQVPTQPKTTYSASVTGGGTSVNSIPNEVWMEFDMRSEDAAELDKVEKRFLTILNQAVETENYARSTKEGAITVDAKLVGDRPAGQTDRNSDIVQFATAAYTAHGVKPEYRTSSTDSNMPMSLKIQALTMPRADKGGRNHSLDEWVDVEKDGNMKVKQIGLTTILAMAGLEATGPSQ